MPDAEIEFAATAIAIESLETVSQQSRHVVLDTNFGDGGRFLQFLTCWLAKRKPDSQLHYIACSRECTFPSQLDESSGVVQSCIDELREQWPSALPGLHRLELFAGRLVLTICCGQAKFYLPRLRARVDWIFADVVLEKQVDENSWMSRAFARMAAGGAGLHLLISSDGALCPGADAFIKKVEASGFRGCSIMGGSEDRVEWSGRFVGSKEGDLEPIRPIVKARNSASVGQAVIIGGGLAGTSVASALARRGWDVLIVEQCRGLAQRASGNLAAVISPMLSKDDSLASRLSRASFLQLLREMRRLNCRLPLVRWEQCGVIQLAADDAQDLAFADLLKTHQYPAGYVRHINAKEVASISGSPSAARGALLFPSAGWVNPPSLCEARLAEDGVRVRFGERVCELVQKGNDWQLFGDGANLIAEATVVVLANGFEATSLDQAQHLHFKTVRGQVTHLRENEVKNLGVVICGDGYLTPSFDGLCSLGATYDFGVKEHSVLEEFTFQNLSRFPKLMLGAPVPGLHAVLGGRVGFRSLTADRMPMIGQLADARLIGKQSDNRSSHWERLSDIPRLPGLFTCLGMGSRGVVWSGMAGEILASLIEGEPSPIEGDLFDAIDPARAILREARRAPSA